MYYINILSEFTRLYNAKTDSYKISNDIVKINSPSQRKRKSIATTQQIEQFSHEHDSFSAHFPAREQKKKTVSSEKNGIKRNEKKERNGKHMEREKFFLKSE